MTSLLGRFGMRVCTVVLGIGLSISVSGCAVASKSVQMDSTSRMPWFGLELKERKKKASGPLFPSVRFDQGSKLRLETVGNSGGKPDGEANPLPQKSSRALPTTDQALVLDSTAAHDSSEFDFR